jgi:NADPH:quinone reductase-like Zn-dependent oxidoreductase
METKKQTAVILEQFGSPVVVKETTIPEPKDGELLVKVIASTVNPSDRLFLKGHYLTNIHPPAVAGFEGVGEIVDFKGETVKDWMGKRVSFTAKGGAWAHYAITTP